NIFSALDLLVSTFINSRYTNQNEFEELIFDLTELFYTLKNDSDDLIDDSEIIAFLFDAYENFANGEMEILYRLANFYISYFHEHNSTKGFSIQDYL
ncbi:MAG: DUF6323 family protein, partial [Solobacterium sp.]|nr:DUF6323 family protein [Solobacterium sp.]